MEQHVLDELIATVKHAYGEPGGKREEAMLAIVHENYDATLSRVEQIERVLNALYYVQMRIQQVVTRLARLRPECEEPLNPEDLSF